MLRSTLLNLFTLFLSACVSPEKIPARDVAAVTPAAGSVDAAKPAGVAKILDPVPVGGNLQLNGEPAVRQPNSPTDGIFRCVGGAQRRRVHVWPRDRESGCDLDR